ncbi:hypothetical protein ACBY01_03030 [Sphingomonas sp. ac-8]|uniref:hypothetical protein n=1 Tax=Sphingomonas sp. ac-8 TaxID=3242977 RepID=UPI003A80CDE3
MTSSDTAILVALVGLLSAAVGGIVQALFARGFERFRFEREAKWELYSKYFQVLGDLTFSKPGTERYQSALSLTAQLRGRIGLVGSVEVVEAVGNVFRYSDFKSPEGQAAMGAALTAMRKDVGKGSRQVSENSLIQLMFGSREVR